MFAGTKEELAVEWNKRLDVPTFLKKWVYHKRGINTYLCIVLLLK
jgi:hypothetical protein